MQKTVTIPEREYLNLKSQINKLQKKIALLQDKDFLSKLNLAYHFFNNFALPSITNHQVVSIKRGSAKQIITYMADDFTAPLPDFQNYM